MMSLKLISVGIAAIVGPAVAFVGAALHREAPAALIGSQGGQPASAFSSTCSGSGDLRVDGGIARDSALMPRIVGFARTAGVTGGLGKPVFVVSSTSDAPRERASGTLRDALNRAQAAGGGWIVFSPALGRAPQIDLVKSVNVPSNVTIDGGCSHVTITTAEPYSILKIMGPSRNVMIARLNLMQRGESVREGGDCITVARGADAVWVGFNNMSKCSDGVVDITQPPGQDQPMRATVAYNHFFDHDKDMLVGSNDCIEAQSEKCDAPAAQAFSFDRGVQVTILGNHFEGTAQRHPRISGRSFVDLAENVVTVRGKPKAGSTKPGGLGAAYGAYVGGGGRLLARDNLFVGLEPDRQLRAVVSADKEGVREREDGRRTGALEGKSLVQVRGNVLVNAAFDYNSAGLPGEPPYTLPAGPRPLSGNWKVFADCIASRTGPDGLARVAAGASCP